MKSRFTLYCTLLLATVAAAQTPGSVASGGPIAAGARVTLTASADGSLPMTWQWYHNGELVSGVTAPTLVIAQLGSTDAGIYSVKVSNDFGSDVSAPAVIVVGVPPTPPTIRIDAVKPSQVQVSVPAGTKVITR